MTFLRTSGRLLWRAVVYIWEGPAESLFDALVTSVLLTVVLHIGLTFGMIGPIKPDWPWRLVPGWGWWLLWTPFLFTWLIVTLRLTAEGATSPWEAKEQIVDRLEAVVTAQPQHIQRTTQPVAGGS